MKSVKEYNIEERNYLRASFFGVIMLVYWLLIRRVLYIDITLLLNPAKVFELPINLSIIHISVWLLICVSVVWTYKIAKKQNRNALSWALFSILLPAIAIIVLGFLKEEHEDEKIVEILNKSRGLFNTEYGIVVNNHEISKEEKNIKLSKLKRDYNLKLQRSLIELKSQELINQISSLKKSGIIDLPVIMEVQKEVLIKDLESNISGSETQCPKCPACNANISSESIICTECELVLK